MANEEEDLNMMMGVAKKLAASSTKRRTSANELALAQSIKESMAKFRDIRQQRWSSIQLPHQAVSEMVASYWNLDSQFILEGIVDSDSHVNLLESFINKDGLMGIIFYYQDGPPYELETGRMHPSDTSITKKRIYVSDGQLSIEDKIIIAYKTQNVALDMRNVNEVTNFIELDANAANKNCVSLVYNVVYSLLFPMLDANTNWGDLLKTESGLRQKRIFERDYAAFCQFLERTKSDLESVIVFDVDDSLVIELLPENRNPHLLDKEFIHNVESIVRIWCKKVERALVQYNQLRRENEFVGPLVEVEYWRNQLTRFTSIKEFVQSKSSQPFVEFLKEAGSPIIKVFCEKLLLEITWRSK